ncbi:xylan 1,4-beta-xylosidase [Asanoa sp. NPDC049518]|uniref:GH39 family glycosyl hydrolase n=1 Tax=unclassified Asanoa TaxID=2685164 RepID=UPI0034452EF0
MTVGDIAAQARAQWVAMMGSGGAQDRAPGEPDAADLPAPVGLTAVTGRGQVTLHWEPVEGAIGYAVHRASASTGPFTVVDHGGGDVLAVPHGPYADTTVEPEREYWYAVAPLATVTAMGPLCTPVRGAALGADSEVAPLVLRVQASSDAGPLERPWRFMVGSEHLSHLLSTDRTGGREIGSELRAALARMHDELGVATVRAHGILDDDLGVYREVAGSAVYDWTGIDRVYDTVVALGMRPIVELGFMPRDLASDPSRTVFTYRGIISPPKDWDRWADLVSSLVRHLVDRYGLDEVRDNWAFEVWNEANLSVFWSGTPAEYWRLYELAARAVKSVDPGLRVGGPATAAVGWVDRQLDVDAPVDFVSTHIYGSPPLDLRAITGDRPLWWTEWGVTATHGNEINDTVFAATFLLRGMRSAAGRIESLAPWVASDHFEELGRPPRFLHGGFGLLTVGNLAKPKFWALWLAQRLGDTAVPAELSGDGADSLVEIWTARDTAGKVGALVWNGTLDHSKRDGDRSLDRTVTIRFEGVAAGRYEVHRWRVDADHGNVAARWRSMGGGDWPTEDQWAALTEADVLPESASIVEAEGGVVELTVDLPNPSIAFVELTPVG